MFELSDNLQSLPPYLFVEIDKAKRKARAAGRDVIDFGIGDPDQPTPGYVIDALCRAARDPANHRYALDQGIPLLRESICAWYRKRFSVSLDPEKGVLPLIGSRRVSRIFRQLFSTPGIIRLFRIRVILLIKAERYSPAEGYT